MVPDTDAKILLNLENRCSSRCNATGNETLKKICNLKCKIQTINKVVSVLRRSSAQAASPDAKKKFADDVKRAGIRLNQYRKQLAKASASPSKPPVGKSVPAPLPGVGM